MNTLKTIPIVMIIMIGVTYCMIMQKSKEVKPFVKIDDREMIGLWQADTKIVSSAWKDAYSFKSDGSFTYYVSQYNELSRLISVKGKYKVDSNILMLVVKSRKEYTGGYIERGSPGFQGGWVYQKATTIELEQQTNQTEEVFLEWSKDDSKNKCIMMDSKKFYKISNNPNDYK